MDKSLHGEPRTGTGLASSALMFSVFLAACQPAPAPATTSTEPVTAGTASIEAAEPNAIAVIDSPSHEPLDGCAWERLVGPEFSVFVQQCTFDDGSTLGHSIANFLGQPAVIETFVTEEQSNTRPVLVVLTTPASFDVKTQLIPTLAALGAAPENPACFVEPFGAPNIDPNPTAVGYELTLRPAALEAYRNEIEAPFEDPESPEPTVDLTEAQVFPCGPFGLSFASERLFRQFSTKTDRLVWIDYGSGLTAFDPESFRFENPSG